MLFRLRDRVGAHNEGGKTYKAGETIDSPYDLAAKWPHKFEKAVPIPFDPEKDKPFAKPRVETAPVEVPVDVAGASIQPVHPPVIPPTDPIANSPDSPETLLGMSDLVKVESKLGKNVTSEFSGAVAKGLIILQRGARYRPADPDLPNTALNKGLHRTEMVEWIETQEDQ